MNSPLGSIESRNPTIRDWMWGVMAISLALAWRKGPALGGGAVGFSIPWYVFALGGVFALALLALWVSALVGWGRQLQYRRRPKGAECLAVAILSFLFVNYFPNLDTTIQAIHNWLELGNQYDFSSWRWGLSVTALGEVLVGNLLVLFFARKFVFVWLLPLLAIWLIVLHWGLLTVLKQELFWPAVLTSPNFPFLDASLLVRDACHTLPTGLVVAIPTLAVLQNCRRPQATWIWSEWLVVLAAAAMGAVLAVLLAWPILSPFRHLEVLVYLAWLCAVFAFSNWALRGMAYFSARATSTKVAGQKLNGSLESPGDP